MLGHGLPADARLCFARAAKRQTLCLPDGAVLHGEDMELLGGSRVLPLGCSNISLHMQRQRIRCS